MGKTKFLCSRHDAPKPVIKSKNPCGVCKAGVGSNSIFCSGCNKWIHKRCTGIKGTLKEDCNFRCKACLGLVVAPVQQDNPEVILQGEVLEVVSDFCYLGDVTGERGGCHDAITARIRCAWKKFRELLPILTCRGFTLRNRGEAFNSCVRKVLLHASETWPVTVEDVKRLERCDHSMIRWICSVKLSDRFSLDELRARLYINPIVEELRWNRLRWYGHIQRMPLDTWPRKVLELEVPGTYPKGRPRKRWSDCINQDLKSKKLSSTMTQDRSKWRTAIRPRLRRPTLKHGEKETQNVE